MLMVDSCGMTGMGRSMSQLLGQLMPTLRQTEREMFSEKEAKAGVRRGGKKRRELVVEEPFADLLRGVIKGWQGAHTWTLAMDASSLSNRFTVVSLSVVYRGCAMRVAWTILPGPGEGAWRPHWERMLHALGAAVPADWMVRVMADRGRDAPWLFRAIQANGWHPFLRVKQGLLCREEGSEVREAVGERVKRTGQAWRGRGSWSETGERVEGTRVVGWEEGDAEPIAVVTDLSPVQGRTAWYQWRCWIECAYKDGKRGWFHWEQSQMLSPERASRLWLVLALAMPQRVLPGGVLEVQEQQEQARARARRCPQRVGRPASPSVRPRNREQSVLMRGMMAYRAAQTGGLVRLPQVRGDAEDWPARLYPMTRVLTPTQQRQHQRRRQRSEQAMARRAVRASARLVQRAARAAARAARRLERARRPAEKAAERAEQARWRAQRAREREARRLECERQPAEKAAARQARAQRRQLPEEERTARRLERERRPAEKAAARQARAQLRAEQEADRVARHLACARRPAEQAAQRTARAQLRAEREAPC